MGLVRRLRLSLQRGVDLESSQLLRSVHDRAARVHILLQCIDVRARQPDSGANDDHCSPDAGTHVDNLTSGHAGTDDGHHGTNASTHVDVQL
jgi:hypothetical protein